ncbi:hypothetical protein K1T71_009131 [Dendrolimus kikuchii]|uniref:Uncharacterized protein n=1 Tax=Dendrolimus kikuchii TaxID=765133 RepID=A0ACC1CTP8_9NEOP|nr:hypothetical protein K1T71_009131 [Dendrolimus kikuchii]
MILFYVLILSVHLIRGTESRTEIINTGVDNGHISSSTVSSALGTETDPCALYSPPKPDFSAPGRRISETKCLEYKWEIKTVAERNNRSEECQADNKKKLLPGDRNGNTHLLQFPHLGAVGWKKDDGTWGFHCGCSLISPQFVLVVAHCAGTNKLPYKNKSPEIVRLGVNNIYQVTDENSSPIDNKIVKIILHPNYNPLRINNDIALLKLEKEIGFTELVHPACLWPKDDLSELGPTATLTGWGNREASDDNARGELFATVVELMDSKECSKTAENFYRNQWPTLTENQLCAGKVDGELEACKMRMGGPLQVKIPLPGVSTDYNLYYTIGIASLGTKCDLKVHLDVYTRVSSFIDWIENEVWS